MIYFDNAATMMPKSKNVINAMTQSLKQCGNPGRSGHIFAQNAAETVYNCRKTLAKIFNTRPELVIFTSGATEALNVAIKGTNRVGGVTLVSSMEHNSVMRPINALRKRGETVMRQFLVDIKSDTVTCENFSAVSGSATNVVITHASNVCGRILPVKTLRSLAPDESVFILDASQTAGHIDVDIVELGVDIICVPGHKGLGGPMGVGALIINPYSDIVIDPLIEGGTGVDSKSYEMPEYYPERLEAGTMNVCGVAGLLAALEELNTSGEETMLFEQLVTSMKNMVDITLYGAPERGRFENYVPLLLFNKTGFDCETLSELLFAEGIAVRAGFHCAPNAHMTLGSYDTGGVRVSLSRHNTRREIERLLSALDSIKK
ncbi:MAG: aminotransferase class V-fold PLP-dependent enzyme [Clostridia bacterium]|nr:aminotransferase class V-fold PLP-dependent enzyme [Clostridia bacterium]